MRAAAQAAPPDPASLTVRAVLLASEHRRIPEEAVALAARLAERSKAPVHVFTIARVWGTTFGLPSPGLLPTKAEWDTQRDHADAAVRALEARGLRADGRVVGTRAGAKRIVAEAARLGCDAIVMGADPPRSPLVRDFMWSQEPYRVQRRAKVPVYLIVDA
jgi:nucleotide-binding universal stress UspA family protein